MWNKYKTPLSMLLQNIEHIENGCINWNGAKNNNGYGKCGNTYWAKYYKINMAHQLSFIIAYGNYERYFQINHTCDNRLCVNPDHLYLGTQQDNIRDMETRERRRVLKGENHRGSKLTESQIFDIRKLCLDGYSNKQIAGLYAVTPAAISSIKNRRSWKHI